MTDMKPSLRMGLVGDGMVGKSRLARTISGHVTDNDCQAILIQEYAGTIKLPGEDFPVCICDPAGQHEYERLRSAMYKDSDVIVMCFSVNDRCSFENITEFWVPEMQKLNGNRVPVVLVGTYIGDQNGNNGDKRRRSDAHKCRRSTDINRKQIPLSDSGDKSPDQKDINGNKKRDSDVTDSVISKDEGVALMKEIGADVFVECSIDEDIDVNKVFIEAAISALAKRRRRNSLIQRLWNRRKSVSGTI